MEQANTGAAQYQWPPLEGNPDIFMNYLEKGGFDLSKYAFNEIYGFEEDLLAFVPQPRFGVIICAERLKKSEDKERGDPSVECDFYTDQSGTLDNACGIIAALHVIYNNGDKVTL